MREKHKKTRTNWSPIPTDSDTHRPYCKPCRPCRPFRLACDASCSRQLLRIICGSRYTAARTIGYTTPPNLLKAHRREIKLMSPPPPPQLIFFPEQPLCSLLSVSAKRYRHTTKQQPPDTPPQRLISAEGTDRGGHIATANSARNHPAHNGAPGNENADERAKLVAEEPNARGAEWLGYSDRAEARTIPPPPDPSHASSERSPRRSGQKPANGLEAGPPGRSTRCRARRSRKARLQ